MSDEEAKMTLIPVHIEPIACLQHEFSDYRVSLLRMHRRNHLSIIYDGKIKPAVMKLTRHKGDLSKKKNNPLEYCLQLLDMFRLLLLCATASSASCIIADLHSTFYPRFFMQLYAFNFLPVN